MNTPGKRSKQFTQLQQYMHEHKRLVIVAAALIVAFVGIWLWRQNTSKQHDTSQNPVLASYHEKLPGLADAAQKHPDDAYVHQQYAVALYAVGDLQKAQAEYEAAVRIAPDNAGMHSGLAGVYRDSGDYQKAAASYQAAIAKDAKLQVAYINLANLYLYTLKQPDAAIKTYNDALQHMPDNQDVQVLLAVAYEQTGDRDRAKQTFQKVLAAHPNNVAAQAGLKRLE